MASQYVAWLSIGVMVYQHIVLVTITPCCSLSVGQQLLRLTRRHRYRLHLLRPSLCGVGLGRYIDT